MIKRLIIDECDPIVSYVTSCMVEKHDLIPLIGKDGDDVINNVTCALTGTESIHIHRVLNGKYGFKSH